MLNMDIVIAESKKIELLLKKYFHASGDNLEQLVESCDERLPSSVTVHLSRLVALKVKMDQENSYQENEENFLTLCALCEEELKPRANRFIWNCVLGLFVVLLLGAIGFYLVHWDYISFSKS